MGVFEQYQERYDATQQEEISLGEYLQLCRENPETYATAAERLLLKLSHQQPGHCHGEQQRVGHRGVERHGADYRAPRSRLWLFPYSGGSVRGF